MRARRRSSVASLTLLIVAVLLLLLIVATLASRRTLLKLLALALRRTLLKLLALAAVVASLGWTLRIVATLAPRRTLTGIASAGRRLLTVAGRRHSLSTTSVRGRRAVRRHSLLTTMLTVWVLSRCSGLATVWQRGKGELRREIIKKKASATHYLTSLLRRLLSLIGVHISSSSRKFENAHERRSSHLRALE